MKIQSLPSGLLALIRVALLSRTALALALHANVLPPRDTCAGREGLSACGLNLPDNFCCATGDTCVRLNNTGVPDAALCCPPDKVCESINVITCDTKFLDPNQFPELPLHASDISIALPTCGNGCCPHGFECVDDALCRIKDSTRQAQESSATATGISLTLSTPSPTQTSTSSVPSSSTSSTETSATSNPQTIEPQKSDNTNTAGLVFAGLIPGLLVGSAITLGVLFFLKKRQQRKRGYKSDTSSSFFGPPTPHSPKPPKISEPIYKPGMSDRVVFGQNRGVSGNTMPDMTTVGGFYKSTNNDNRRTADSATLVSPPGSSNKKVRTLDPPFETPTKHGRGARGDAARSFFSRSSSRTSRRNTQGTTNSMETISMTMGPPRVPSSYQNTPQVRQTTYSDVYRAAGVSPSQVRSTRPSEDVLR